MQSFRRILVHADTKETDTTVSRAIELAIENNASLTLIDVVKPQPRGLGILSPGTDFEELESLVVKDHERQLLEIASEYSDTAVPLEVTVVVGDPATEIVRQVLDGGHDLVVKSADGISSSGLWFGSVAKSLLRLCPCPVWLLKPAIHGEFDHVLAAIDVDTQDPTHLKLNQRILELAFSIAHRDHAELHIVSAWQLWMEDSLRRRSEQEALEAAMAAHESKVRMALDDLLQTPFADTRTVKLHLQHGPAAAVIRNVADEIEADLMVMGTVCRTGVAGFLIGNTAESVLSGITCSLLAIKPEGFVTPIEMSKTVLTETDEELPQL